LSIRWNGWFSSDGVISIRCDLLVISRLDIGTNESYPEAAVSIDAEMKLKLIQIIDMRN